MDWWKVVNSDDRLDLGGHPWIQVFDKETGLILASLVYGVNEKIEPSEVLGARVFDANFRRSIERVLIS
jgi:hypothetical protein